MADKQVGVLEYVTDLHWLPQRARNVIFLVSPIAGLILAFTLFSLYTVLVKKALSDGTNPIVLAFLREVIATAALLPAAYFAQWRKPNAAERKFWPEGGDLGWFILLGALMIWGVQLLSALSLQHISANQYALLAPTVPVFTLIIALLTGFEHFKSTSALSWAKLASILITVAGAFYIAIAAYFAAGGRSRNVVLGFAFLLTNKLCVSTYPILEKRLLKRYDPMTIVAWGYTAGAVQTLMSVIPCATDADAWRMSTSGVYTIFYSGLVSSAFNYALMCHVNKHTSPVLVMAFYPLQSVATPILAWLILGAPFTGTDATGGSIIIIGLFCLVLARYVEGRWGGGDAPAGLGAHVHLEEEEDPAPKALMQGSGGEGTPAFNATMHANDGDAPRRGRAPARPPVPLLQRAPGSAEDDSVAATAADPFGEHDDARAGRHV